MSSLKTLKFDVEETTQGIELIPDFYIANIPRDIREGYRDMVDSMNFERGAIQLTGPDQEIFNPPERVDMEEINTRMKKEFGITVLTEDGFQASD